MQHLEVESKFELSEQDFERLRYDAHWQLADRASTLRIRFCGGKQPVLTLKAPFGQEGAKRTMREIEIPLSRHCRFGLRSAHATSIDVENELPGELRDYLLTLGVRSLRRVGWVRNIRFVLEVRDLGEIELDRLELPDGTTVFEAEIETDNAWVHERLSQLVCTLAPAAKPSLLSKFQRFRTAAARAPRAHECAAAR
jgi:hypothetical protein